jgi:hypothetical protein
MLCFVFPSFAYLKICGGDMGRAQYMATCLFLVFSICIMVYTTTEAFHTMFSHLMKGKH